MCTNQLLVSKLSEPVYYTNIYRKRIACDSSNRLAEFELDYSMPILSFKQPNSHPSDRPGAGEEVNGGRHGDLHRHHPRHHPAASRRLLQVRLRDRVLDLLAAHLLRLPPRHHLRHLGHHQVGGEPPFKQEKQVMIRSL
ncbi:hypothetical protein GUJ93_ZPchr0007g3762 [Zizania palustris]|uniref:Uncharacterized protein n=1 Tax=Zizania palustris TaxID=103762 RepID=A0A8J5VP30_ZIZPA|nr:hypothetical protein GUJ93_ZPchr0007g3762 [Zizania palustris]